MIYEKTNNFFIQKIYIINIEESRFSFFANLCKDKKVLHVGCADALHFNIDDNLHILLDGYASELHGMDIDENDLNKLKQICKSKYFSNLNDCDRKYDIILVPEVLEHVFNAKEFLDQIFAISFKELIITVPNIIHYGKEMIEEDNSFIEIVHPDHKYWFSPYTLYNIIKPYIKNENNCKMYYLENKSMVGIHIIN